MKLICLFGFLLCTVQLKEQTENNICKAFLSSIKEKNFSKLKPWLGPNEKALKTKWQKIVENAHRPGFDIDLVRIDSVITGQLIQGLPLKSVIAVYQYDGKQWDDLLLMLGTEEPIKIFEIPLTSYMFMLEEGKRGKNLSDSLKQ